MIYPSHLVGWLTDILEGIEWRWTPVQVLETEQQYPGLMNDLATEVWQRRLIKEQMSQEQEKDNGG